MPFECLNLSQKRCKSFDPCVIDVSFFAVVLNFNLFFFLFGCLKQAKEFNLLLTCGFCFQAKPRGYEFVCDDFRMSTSLS